MRHRRPLILSPFVAASAFALLAAGCGGGGSPAGVASVNTTATVSTTTPTTPNPLAAFSTCMRANGVTNFPDPQRFADGNLKLTLHQIPPETPHLRTAMNACTHLIPNGGPASQETAQQARTRLADELSFARCMRTHGLTRFPDPTAQGELSVEMVQAQGIDVHSPAVLRVVQACLPASHGALTPAMVRQAIANASH